MAASKDKVEKQELTKVDVVAGNTDVLTVRLLAAIDLSLKEMLKILRDKNV